MFNISSAMAAQFAAAAEEMTRQMQELGPNPLYHAGQVTEETHSPKDEPDGG